MTASSVRSGTIALFLLASLAAFTPMRAQSPSPAIVDPSYADLADLVLVSPVIVDATIRSTARIKGAEAAGVMPDRARLYVTSDIDSLVRGPEGLPPRIGYLLDARLGSDGRMPKFKKARVLLFARAVPDAPNQLQLSTVDAQYGWTSELDLRVKNIVRETLAADAAPRVTAVGNAFHVAGALPGEGETQVFVQTQGGRPVSLSVLQRPGERRRWSVALSEIVDEAAGPPKRDTLLWYRLACGLPPALPAASTASLAEDDARIAEDDYRFVLNQLGPCGRSHG